MSIQAKITSLDFWANSSAKEALFRAKAYQHAWTLAKHCRASKRLCDELRIYMRSWAREAVRSARRSVQRRGFSVRPRKAA